MIDLSSLDSNQLQAAQSGTGTHLVIAGPGSGKTRTLTFRYARLVEEGVKPDRILSITFSKNAAEEMAHRIAKLTNRDFDSIKRWVCTFHSLGAKIILMSAAELGFKLSETPIQPFGARRILGEIVRDKSLLGGFEMKYADARTFISKAKRNDKDWTQIAWEIGKNDPQAIAYREYETRKRQVGIIDYDDMIFLCWRLLRDKPEVRQRWQAKFDYVMVDEFHDTDQVQMNIVKTLAEPQNNIFCVLDPNQSIYSWRGSDYKLAFELEKQYQDSRRVLLATNYRSVEPVVGLYKRVIHGAPSLVEGFLESIKHVREHPENPEPQFHKFVTDAQEARWVADDIKAQRANSHLEAAVLYRTNRQSAPIEQLLFAEGIPYVIQGATSFFGRPEIKAVMAFLRIVEDKYDNEAMRQIILGRCECSKHLGKKFFEDLLLEAGPTGSAFNQLLRAPGKNWQRGRADELHYFLQRLTEQCNGVKQGIWSNQQGAPKSLEEQINIIVRETDIVGALTEGEDLEDMDNLVEENVAELAKAAGQFRGTRKEWIAYTETMSVRGKEDDRSVLNVNPVRLMSIHRSKGMEFESVYLVGANDGILPHKLGDPDEEQRLAYVAVSRCKDFLHVSCWEQPSAFFAEHFEVVQQEA